MLKLLCIELLPQIAITRKQRGRLLGNRPRQGVAVVSTPILTRYYFEVIDDYLLEVRRSSIATLVYYVRSTRHIYSPNTYYLGIYLGIYLGNILSQHTPVVHQFICAPFFRDEP